jgi:hypothetical protein
MTRGNWDHPEFCLEANENGNYVYFDFDDFKIEFFVHGRMCVNFRKTTDACQNKLTSQESFIRLMEAGRVPSLLKLRERLSVNAFRELFQIKYPTDALSEKLLEFVKFELCQVERIDQSSLIKMKFNAFIRNDLDEILAKLGEQSDSFAQIRSDLVEKFTKELRNISVGLGPARGLFSARPEPPGPNPGRAEKSPARVRGQPGLGPRVIGPGQPAGFLYFFYIFVLGLVYNNFTILTSFIFHKEI